jgi:hypothetical protein
MHLSKTLNPAKNLLIKLGKNYTEENLCVGAIWEIWIPTATRRNTVRRQGFWNQELRNLRESLAHLVGCIMRRVVCDASVALRGSFV